MTSASTLPSQFYVSPGRRGPHLSAETPESGSPYVSLAWASERGELIVSETADLTGASPSDHSIVYLANALGAVNQLGAIFNTIYRIHHTIPAEFTPVLVQAGSTFQSWIQEETARRVRSLLTATPVLDYILPPKRSGSPRMTGWFAPGSDPEVMGTAFLVPTALGQSIGWSIEYVALGVYSDNNRRDNFAAWNDPTGMAELVQRCRENDPEYMETLALIDDADAYNRSKDLYRERDAFTRAREEFRPRDCIKPTVVATEVSRAADDTSRELGLARWDVRLNSWTADLVPRNRAVLPARTKSRPVAMTITLSSNADEGLLDRFTRLFIEKLGARLAVDKLGVVRVGSDGRIWVVKNPELVVKHPRACMIPAGYVLREANLTVGAP